jgi:hypothetical protein
MVHGKSDVVSPGDQIAENVLCRLLAWLRDIADRTLTVFKVFRF